MTPRSRGLRFALVIAGLAALCGTAQASDDDFDFANALSNRGYQDLAEEQFNKLLTDPKRSAKEKAEGQYGLALIKRYNALVGALEANDRRRKPMPEILTLFDEADASLEQFIERNSGHPRLLEAKLNRAKLITDRADYIDRAIENDWVPSDVTIADLKTKVAEGYDTAIGLLKTVEDSARKELDKQQPNTPEYSAAEDKLGIVWLYRIAALYGKGAALPDGDTAGVAALNQALAEIADFMWLFDGTVRGLWAFHYSALCNWRLDKPNDAVRDMRDAATYVQEADGVLAARAIAMQSFEKLGDIAIDVAPRHGDEFLETAQSVLEQLPVKWPSYMEDGAGQRAALSEARLLAAMGKGAQALELVQEVIKKAAEKGTRVDYEAGKVLSELIAVDSGNAAALDPALLNRIAMSKWADADMRGAIKGFQAVIGACATPEKMDEYGWPAWDFIGRCYGIEGRYYEAYLAFMTIEDAWTKDPKNEVLVELTNEAAYSAAKSLNALAVASKDKAEQKRLASLKDAVLADFAEKHPDSPRNQSAGYAAAETKRGEAQALRRGGDYAGALAVFGEARKLYAAIEKTNPAIDKINARLADMTRQEALCHKGAGDDAKALALYDKAIAESVAWLDAKRAPAVESEVRRARAAGRSISLTNLLTALSLRADVIADADAKTAAYQASLDALEKYEDEFVKGVNRGQALVDQWRAEALIGVGQIDLADELVSKLIAENPDLANGPYLAALVAKAREKEAEEWTRKTDLGRARDRYTRAAKLREYAITKTGDPSAASYKFLGDTFGKAEDFASSEKYYRLALTKYEEKGEADQARALRIELIGLLIDQGKFEEAIPQLEVMLVPVDGDRQKVLDRLGLNDQINTDELKEIMGIMSRNKRVLDVLSRAYLKAGRNEKDYLRCINLSAIMIFAHPKDDRHDAAWIEYQLRLAEGYLQYGLLTGKPEAYRAASSIITNRVVVPGLLDSYDERLPGSKKRFEEIKRKADSKK